MNNDRAAFKQLVLSGPVTLAPLCMDALTARLCQSIGFQAGYLSGGALGYSMAVSEALLSANEVVAAAASITRRSGLPLIADINVGFGDAVHLSRVIGDFEAAGVAAVEIEDQVAPKRVSHHRGIEHLVSLEEMVGKVETAVSVRTDPDLLIIARTNAMGNEGFDRAIERGRAYAAAGADLVMVFPTNEQQWRDTPPALECPVAAIEPFSVRSPNEWTDLGYSLIIDVLTGQVAAFDAVRAAYNAAWAQDADTQRSRSSLFEVYRQLSGVAGLDDYYAIEARTTESRSRPNPLLVETR